MHVTKWGNSLGIRIPMALAKKAGLTEGTPIDFEVNNDTIIIRRKRYTLENLLSEVNSKNIHHEINTGAPVGREIW
jgi:antitoxin MazE